MLSESPTGFHTILLRKVYIEKIHRHQSVCLHEMREHDLHGRYRSAKADSKEMINISRKPTIVIIRYLWCPFQFNIQPWPSLPQGRYHISCSMLQNCCKSLFRTCSWNTS